MNKIVGYYLFELNPIKLLEAQKFQGARGVSWEGEDLGFTLLTWFMTTKANFVTLEGLEHSTPCT